MILCTRPRLEGDRMLEQHLNPLLHDAAWKVMAGAGDAFRMTNQREVIFNAKRMEVPPGTKPYLF